MSVTDANNCTETLQVTVPADFNSIPVAGFTTDINGTTVSFSNTSVNATAYFWDFGNGQTSQAPDIILTFDIDGVYQIMLTVFNPCGSNTFVQTVGIVDAAEPDWLKQFTLSPNPNNGIFTLVMNGKPSDEVTFCLFATDGSMLRCEKSTFQSGSLLKSFAYSDLPEGLYLLRIQANGRSKFVKVAITY